MKHTFITLVTMLLFAASIPASGKKNVPELRFKDGELKILQLTDTHLRYGDPKEYAKTFARIDAVIRDEKPDFIALTGDIVTGSKETRTFMWDILIDHLESYSIPFCLVFGNHDAEGNMTRQEMSARICASPYSMNRTGKNGELADIRIPVQPSSGEGDALDLYFLDSHDYPQNCGFKAGVYGSYAWFNHSQVDWLRNECLASTSANGGNHVPSLAFFHIPLVEYNVAFDNGEAIGVRGESGGEAKINSGMFAAMLETGNVMGVFTGHDHDSNFIVSHYGIALAYGGFSGDDTTYNHLAHGLRVIVVKEGERSFDTWIHEEDGRIQFKARYQDGKIDRIKN